jgi:hypothetical protein
MGLTRAAGKPSPRHSWGDLLLIKSQCRQRIFGCRSIIWSQRMRNQPHHLPRRLVLSLPLIRDRPQNCTAPAIRYIVARTSTRGATATKMGRGKLEKIAVIASAEYRQSTRIGGFAPDSPMRDLWSRVNTDIATFLAGIDSLASDDSDASCEALHEATDRLLWASARTHLELERLLGNRKRGASLRRMSG